MLGQDPDHELMILFADALRDLGVRIREKCAGRDLALAEAAGGSAVALAELLARWPSFPTCRPTKASPCRSSRAQIAAADLVHANVANQVR